MKVVILAGGFGTRISEETEDKPKPMINIGGQPIILHIMKHYAKYGYNDFIICLGYKGYALKEYFANYYLHNSDITFDYSDNSQVFHQSRAEDWKVTLIDTGLQSMTGGRVKRAKKFISPDEPFMLTYGDGLSDVNISELVKAHESSEKICTVTAVAPPGRFGSLKIENNSVVEFQEKPLGDGGLINGGFLVCKHSFFNYIEGDSTVLEQEPLRKLASEGQLASFKHKGFWQPMDTLRDKLALEKIWDSGEAPWTK
jgi:glucose-1-phosphate cytidylyltransferase